MSVRGVGRLLPITLVSMLTLWLMVGCAGSSEEGGTQRESADPVTGSFVGVISEDPAVFVALVVDEPEEGEEMREARAYLCDGEWFNEWLQVGSADGNELEISSDAGAQLVGELAPEAATGTITLTDGRSFSFEAPPATGVAGLYNLTQNADGSFIGTSERGGQLEGQLAGPPQGTPTSITGTITPPEGEPVEFETAPANIDEPGDFRAIVQPDARLKGGKKGKETTGYYIFTLLD